MEWKIYLRHQEKSYRILKLRQGANFDITVIPHNAVLFSKEILVDLNFDDQIRIEYESLGQEIDHYSAHARTGQRHVKLTPNAPATEPVIGANFQNIQSPIPLLTMVAAANTQSQEEPTSGKWFGFQLPDDINYMIIELSAIPKRSQIQIQQSFTINNEKQTKETFDIKTIEMRNCIIVVLIRTTNHALTDIPNNVVFQQVEGKSINIVRVEKGAVLAQVSHLVAK